MCECVYLYLIYLNTECRRIKFLENVYKDLFQDAKWEMKNMTLDKLLQTYQPISYLLFNFVVCNNFEIFSFKLDILAIDAYKSFIFDLFCALVL